MQIRRAYKNLATKEHPDKGGSQEKFQLLQKAYQVLSNTGTAVLGQRSSRMCITCHASSFPAWT